MIVAEELRHRHLTDGPTDRPEQARCHRIWCALPRTMDTFVHHRANLRAYAGELFIGKRIEIKQFQNIRYSLVG
jgi:hypothetical protein